MVQDMIAQVHTLLVLLGMTLPRHVILDVTDKNLKPWRPEMWWRIGAKVQRVEHTPVTTVDEMIDRIVRVIPFFIEVF